MKVNIDLPVHVKKARTMRKWIQHIEANGELDVLIEALFECETSDTEMALARWGNVLTKDDLNYDNDLD